MNYKFQSSDFKILNLFINDAIGYSDEIEKTLYNVNQQDLISKKKLFPVSSMRSGLKQKIVNSISALR